MMTSYDHCSEGPIAQILRWAPHLLGPDLELSTTVPQNIQLRSFWVLRI